MTLHGCLIGVDRGHVRVSREPAAVAHLRGAPNASWDGRWRLSGPDPPEDTELRALGRAGLRLCPDRHEIGLPATSLAASPALWQGGTLLAAPLAGLGRRLVTADGAGDRGILRHPPRDVIGALKMP